MSEARSEHEFENRYGEKIVVFWRQGPRWRARYKDGFRYAALHEDLADEIAKLAGLVPPGGEEEKG